MTWIPFALLLIAAFIAWKWEAPREAKLIAQNMGGPDLDHSKLVWRRVYMLAALVICAGFFDHVSGWRSWLMYLPYSGIAWAGFTISHRWRLNAIRGPGWWYLSTGNAYDRFWLDLSCDDWWTTNPSRKEMDRQLRRAGTLAYIFELFFLALSIGGAVAILHCGDGDPATPSGSTLQVLLRSAQSGLFTSIPNATLG